MIQLQDGLAREAAFSLLRLRGFAPSHAHAFVLRGTEGEALFRPGPVARDAIVAAIGLPGSSLHLARQVHGAGAVEYPPRPHAAHEPAHSPDEPVEADALIARARGHAVGVATADCLPILLASGGGACAAVHAGWRGLLAGVIEAALARLEGDGPIEAAIGPAIGPCCFEVGDEVVARFEERFSRSREIVRSEEGRKSRIDLPAAALAVLSGHGVDPSRVRTVGLCTRCGPQDLVESFRRDGKGAGRMIAVIGTL